MDDGSATATQVVWQLEVVRGWSGGQSNPSREVLPRTRLLSWKTETLRLATHVWWPMQREEGDRFLETCRCPLVEGGRLRDHAWARIFVDLTIPLEE